MKCRGAKCISQSLTSTSERRNTLREQVAQRSADAEKNTEEVAERSWLREGMAHRTVC